MTRTLDAAIAKLASLPPDEQDRLGRWLLDELEDDARWDREFHASQDALLRLADEARVDRERARTTPLNTEEP